MKKRIWKKLVALGLALTLFLSYGNVTTLAASSVSGNVDGMTVSGSVSMDSSSATAVTSYARGGGTIYATATVYYWWGLDCYEISVGPNTASAGGVSAKATKAHGGGEVVAGKGTHKLVWGAYTWRPADTVVGTIPSYTIKY